MRQRAGGGRAVAALARVGLHPVDQLLERLGRHLRADGDGEIEGGDLGDRLEVADGIVGQRLVDVGIDRHRRDRREQQGLAVRRGGFHRLHADAALGAGAVLDDDGLVEGDAQVLGDQPRQGIARAAGGKREDDADRLAADLGARGREAAARPSPARRQVARPVLRMSFRRIAIRPFRAAKPLLRLSCRRSPHPPCRGSTAHHWVEETLPRHHHRPEPVEGRPRMPAVVRQAHHGVGDRRPSLPLAQILAPQLARARRSRPTRRSGCRGAATCRAGRGSAAPRCVVRCDRRSPQALSAPMSRRRSSSKAGSAPRSRNSLGSASRS